MATGDTDGDGRPNVITGPGSGTPSVVRAFNSAFTQTLSFTAFDPSFTGGVFVG